MKCFYGCGNDGLFLNKSNNLMCSKSHNSCPALKEKNRQITLKSYSEKNRKSFSEIYKELPIEIKNKMNTRKDKNFATFEYNGTGNHKSFLIRERGHQCEECKNTHWLEKKIKLELEHTDGDSKNNVKSNLKLLCPNCHSMTPTWRKRKTLGNGKNYSDEEIIRAIKESENINQTLKKLNLKYGSASTIVSVMGKYQVNFKEKIIMSNINKFNPKPITT